MVKLICAFLILLLCSSCLVVKVYQSPEPSNTERQKPQLIHRGMIGSGEKVDLGDNGIQEILFFSDEIAPKGTLFKSGKGEILVDTLSSKENIWETKKRATNVSIISTESASPLLIINGKISDDRNILKTLNSDEIKTINVIKGEAAIKAYGESAVNGVIEIRLKKEQP